MLPRLGLYCPNFSLTFKRSAEFITSKMTQCDFTIHEQTIHRHVVAFASVPPSAEGGELPSIDVTLLAYKQQLSLQVRQLFLSMPVDPRRLNEYQYMSITICSYVYTFGGMFCQERVDSSTQLTQLLTDVILHWQQTLVRSSNE